jgi:hypothetical protein
MPIGYLRLEPRSRGFIGTRQSTKQINLPTKLQLSLRGGRHNDGATQLKRATRTDRRSIDRWHRCRIRCHEYRTRLRNAQCGPRHGLTLLLSGIY